MPTLDLEIPLAAGSTTAAWVAAAAAILAAIVAAVASVGRESYLAYLRRRGIATLLGEDLFRWEGQIVEAFYQGKWWPEGELLAGQSTPEDLKQAAVALRPHAWWTVSSARRWVEYLEAVRARKVTEQVGDDPKERATYVPDVEANEKRWLAETFYRLEAARWGLHRQALSLRDRRDLIGHWRPYRQENLKERYAPTLSEKEALVTLGPGRTTELDALLGGVSEFLSSDGAELMPDGLR